MSIEVVITEWALDSYLNLKHQKVFGDAYYWGTVRPDVELLSLFPNDPKFGNSKFWGPATDKSGNAIPNGFKMKWRQVGPGRVQLRLCVAITKAPADAAARAYLCRAYVKSDDKVDKREAAKLKRHINLIHRGQYVFRGKL
ncbi:MAG: hypothetical protein AAF411_24235 [Myxococcota bacterium]